MHIYSISLAGVETPLLPRFIGGAWPTGKATAEEELRRVSHKERNRQMGFVGYTRREKLTNLPIQSENLRVAHAFRPTYIPYCNIGTIWLKNFNEIPYLT